MATKRSYHDPCGLARALDTVGERWALLIVRELMLGPKRFSDIRTGLPALSPDILTQRLRELEQSGVVARRTLPPPAASQVYELTPAGLALEPVLTALGRWGGANTSEPTGSPPISLEATMLSLRTLFEPELATDLDVTIQLIVEGQPFRAIVAGGQIVVERGDAAAPDVTVTTDASTMFAVTQSVMTVADAVASGAATVEGDRDALERFVVLFPMPVAAA